MTGVCILQLQSKDLVDSNVEIKSDKRYKAVLDYSLESIKLNEVHKKVFRNNKFIFKKNGKLYTNDIISVCFDYKHENYSKKELREKLYRDGFYCFGEHYVRYKRSGGSARVGKCLFIQEKLYKPMMEWSYMGLDFHENSPVDLASKEAYIALTTSSIIDTLNIYPNEILMIDDYESVFKDKVVSVKENEKFNLYAVEEEVEVKNNIWDGQSLLDSSVFEKKYKDKGMLLLRNRFFKSCCFNTNIQKFFKDNGITDISQLNGITYAKDISQIKMITTPSSIKYLKFGDFDKWIENLEPMFGVVKYDKPTHFFKGNLVQTHYQLINTLELSREEVIDFLSDSMEYVLLLKNDLSVLRNHLKMKIDSDSLNISDMRTSSDFIYNMLSINDDIKNTSMFINFKKELVKSFVNNMKKGHILINGNYSTILGNGYEMLLSSIGKFDGKSILEVDEVASKRFSVGEKIMGIRSPHVTLGNIWLVKNKYPEEYRKYFNLTNQILVINSINSNVLNRLNGCDFDSDSLMLTNNQLLIKSAEKNYNEFLVPTSDIKSKKIERLENYWHKFDLDEKTSVNKIGEIINLSQVLNSYLWEMKKQDKDYSEVYRDICILAVMSNVEIDAAKKEFNVNNSKELKILRNKYKFLTQRPMFFYHLPNDFKQPRNPDKYRKYETSMDYLVDEIIKGVKKIRMKHEEKICVADLFVDREINISHYDKKKAKKIIKLCEILKTQSDLIWSDSDLNNSDKYFKALEIRNEFIENLEKEKINENIVKYILKNTPDRIQRKMFFVLYYSFTDVVKSVITNKKQPIETIILDDDGELILYGLKHKILQF